MAGKKKKKMNSRSNYLVKVKIIYKGEPFQIATPRYQKIKTFLDNLPDDVLLSYSDVADALGLKLSTVANATHDFPELKSYHIRLKGKAFFGKPKTIQKIKKELS